MGSNTRRSFSEFWPYYLGEHSRPETRWFHLLATLALWSLLIAALATKVWWLLLAIPVAAYGLAWFSHFFIEHNRPATFSQPLYSLLADHKMAFYMITGRLGQELNRLNITPRG